MTVTLELPDEAMRRLRAEAERRDLSVDALIAEFAGTLGRAASAPRSLGFVAIGESTSGRHAADADEMLAEGFAQRLP